MIVRCWGARGSIPVCGREYLKYGGNTTCIEIRTRDDEIIIIDAGSGIRALGDQLIKENRFDYTVIFTHAHLDHVLGFPFFRPVYFKKTHIAMYGCPFAQNSVKKIISRTMSPPTFPISFADCNATVSYHGACKETFTIGSVRITPILLSHPNKGIGYKFVEDDRCFVFLTDNELRYIHPGGLSYKEYFEFITEADLLMHDAEFTREEYKKTKAWGHSTYEDALELAMEAQVKRFGLFHHNQERTDSGVDKIVDDCQSVIETNKSRLMCFAAYEGMEITV